MMNPTRIAIPRFSVFSALLLISVSVLFTPPVNAAPPPPVPEDVMQVVARVHNQVSSQTEAAQQSVRQFAMKLSEHFDALKALSDKGVALERTGCKEEAQLLLNSEFLQVLGQIKTTVEELEPGVLRAAEGLDRMVLSVDRDFAFLKDMTSERLAGLAAARDIQKDNLDRTIERMEKAAESLNGARGRKKARYERLFQVANNNAARAMVRMKVFKARALATERSAQLAEGMKSRLQGEVALMGDNLRLFLTQLWGTLGKAAMLAEGQGFTSGLASTKTGFANLDEMSKSLGLLTASLTKLDSAVDKNIDTMLAQLSGFTLPDENGQAVKGVSVDNMLAYWRSVQASLEN